MVFCVRSMTINDIDQVAEIDHEAFPTQWPPANFRHELQNHLAHYVVAIDSNRKVEPPVKPPGIFDRMKDWFQPRPIQIPPPREYVAGFSGIWLMADESHITSIAVREEYRGRRLGELLMIATIDMARELKADVVTLEVRVSNTIAQKLYLKYGFKKVGLRRAYYTDNREDADIMTTDPISSPEYLEFYNGLKSTFYSNNPGAVITSPYRAARL